MTEHSAEYEQVRQAVQPVVATTFEYPWSEGDLERAAMLAVVDARQDEHHRWDIVGPPDCPRCAELAALRKEIEDWQAWHGGEDAS